MELLYAIVAVAIAAGIPVLFLLLIFALDLYACRSIKLVLVCFAWGIGGGILLAYLINSQVSIPLMKRFRLDYVLLFLIFAPVVEESVKLLPLFSVVRHPKFTYFVDGAIYGFASGIGFSIAENFIYMYQHTDEAIAIAWVRAFSTCLMHGSATALVGAAIGRFRLQRYMYRRLLAVGSWLLSIILHSLFNLVVIAAPVDGFLVIPATMVIGFGCVGTIAWFIFVGLREQQSWLVESLDQHAIDLLHADLSSQEQEWLASILDQESGVSFAEVKASQAYQFLDDVLAPISVQFPHRADLMKQIVLQQAQISIKRRLLGEIDHPKAQQGLASEIARLEEVTKDLRKEAGRCAMAFLKAVFDDPEADVSVLLEDMIACGKHAK